MESPMPVEEEDPSYVYVLANTVRLQDAAQVVADYRRAYLTAWNMSDATAVPLHTVFIARKRFLDPDAFG